MDEGGAEIENLNVSPEAEAWKMEEHTFAERLKERFYKTLGKTPESLGIPKVTLDIYYHIHAGREEARKVSEHFKTADIYIPEMLGWSEQRLDVVNRISQGKITPEDGAREMGYNPHHAHARYDFQLMQMIYKSNTPVAYIDYSRDDPRFREAINATERMADIPKYWEYGKSFPEILQEIKKRTKNSGIVDQEREEFMTNNLKNTITTIVENNPPLRKKAKEKGNFNILLSVGSVHTALSHLLASGDNDVSSKFSTSPMIYSYMHEGERRYRAGNPIDDNFAAKMLAEGLISSVFGHDIKNKIPTAEARFKFFREIAGKFSYQDVETIVQKNPDGQHEPMKNDLLQIISRGSQEQYELLLAA